MSFLERFEVFSEHFNNRFFRPTFVWMSPSYFFENWVDMPRMGFSWKYIGFEQVGSYLKGEKTKTPKWYFENVNLIILFIYLQLKNDQFPAHFLQIFSVQIQIQIHRRYKYFIEIPAAHTIRIRYQALQSVLHHTTSYGVKNYYYYYLNDCPSMNPM